MNLEKLVVVTQGPFSWTEYRDRRTGQVVTITRGPDMGVGKGRISRRVEYSTQYNEAVAKMVCKPLKEEFKRDNLL